MPTTAESGPDLIVAPPAACGTRLVLDPARHESFVVYRAAHRHQERNGHELGLWYFQAVGRVDHGLSSSPRSCGYDTAGAAVEALRCSQHAKGGA